MKFLGGLTVLVAAVNVAVLAFLPSYELRLGPFHLPAHGLFKPLLYLGGAVLFATLAQSRKPAEEEARWIPPDWLIGLAAVATYLPSLGVTINHEEWAHRLGSEGVRSLGDLARMFAERHPDGFYRPLTFFSLWLDYRIFSDHLWAYHLQNLVLHAANAVLVAKLARAESGLRDCRLWRFTIRHSARKL